MSSGMKTLAKETFFYGLGSVFPKLLSWFLSLYWAFVLPRISDIGVLTNFYAWVALLQVILTYGMETGFFRFANKEKDPDLVFSTSFISILTTTTAFLLLAILFLKPVAFALGGEDMKPHYLLMLVLILCVDVIGTIPFAKLRFKNRPIRFASIKILNVVLTILLNLFFFLVCPQLQNRFPGAFAWYDINYGVDYILVSNLVASIIQFLMVSTELRVKLRLDKQLLAKMLKYSFPILILGVAGVLNQTVDKIIFPMLYPNQDVAFVELGIYGQNFKIAVIMVMFTQAFRYAFEPFIFARSKGSNSELQSFSDATKYFIIFGLLIYLVTTGFLDVIKFLLPTEYHVGLKVVPIVLLGELFFGVYFNLSLWYKLTDKTEWGAYFSIFGFIITIAINVIFIPKYSYMACAFASLLANLSMMVASYIIGQKNYPIPYNLKSAAGFFLLAMAMFFIFVLNNMFIARVWLRICLNIVLILIYLYVVVKKELPLRDWPIVGKYFK